MNEQDLQKHLEDLKKQINYHNYRYHVLDDPVISDSEYDHLVIQLNEIEGKHPEWITPDSPSQRAGAAPSEKFIKVRHPKPILSLANAFNNDDIVSWYERISKLDDNVKLTDFVVEPKLDGLTVVLHYREGIFFQGTTRGDGIIGEDITENLRTIRALPLQIPINPGKQRPPNELVVRGEAFITIKDFNLLNKQLEKEGESAYQNPRNTAAGALRQLDSRLTAKRPLTIIVYSIIASDERLPKTQYEQLQYLQALGFPIPETVYCKTIEDINNAYNHFLANRENLPYEADGVVIKINNLSLSEKLGFVGKDPRGSIAYKFPAREVTTKLVKIGVNVGRTGVLTPYAILEPVEVGGVIVRQATLHNFDYIHDKDIRIGDRVIIKRAGDVIPYVIGSIVELRSGAEAEFKPPDICPACGQPVEHFAGEVAWYCVNNSCSAQLIRNVEHFASRGAMEISGLGIKIVEQLVAENFIKDIADIYVLSKDNLLTLEGFADKKANNLLEAIQDSKKRPLSRLIYALGIRGVGEVLAVELADHYYSLDQLSRAKLDDLQKIEGIGPNIALAVVDWFTRESNQQVLDKFKKFGVWPEEELREKFSEQIKLLNLTFVITGSIDGYSREDIKDIIQKNGGKVSESVSHNTNYLIVGENPGSKLEKARKLGVSTIDIDILNKLINK
jgi:DNA ligase (NAD+)